MKKPTAAFGLGLFGLILLLPPTLSPNAVRIKSNLVLVHGTLIDGTGAGPIPDSVIIIQNETIAAVGRFSQIKIPEDIKIIDLKGATILPGFINAHVHRGYNEHNLAAWAQAGVTTVRDVGADPRNNLFAFRDRVVTKPQYARLVAAGPMVTVPGGYPTVPWGAPTALPVTSPDDARQKVGHLLDEGADIIKIALDSGKSFNRKIPMLNLAEAKAVVTTTHQWGTLVSAHVLVSKDLEHALNAGADDIAHMVMDDPSDALIRRVVKDNVYWVPTLELWHGVNPRLLAIAQNNLKRFVQAGGQVALGTDYAGYNSRFDLGMPIREIRWMRESGMTPLQIITAATKNAAFICNLADKLGTLELGKIADILIINGDPLKDLNALLDIRLVIHSGRIINTSEQ